MTRLGPSSAIRPLQPEPGSAAGGTRSIGGLPHVVAEVTPEQAQTSDLLALAELFEDAGLEPWLLRRSSGRPALALPASQREVALAALDAAAQRDPWAAARREEGTVRPVVAGAARAFGGSGAATVFRPRTVPSGSLRYGAEHGVRVEFWRREGGVLRAPRRNALTRRTIAVDDLAFETVRRHGRTWKTIAGMFAPGANEFTQEVDIVFSWVDGSSNEFQRERAKRMNAYVVGDGDAHAARYRQVDELRYALRSVHMFAPWIRTIWIATDSPAPWWLREHPRVRIVRSEEFFADPSVLPTHNSHAVEAQLHRIPGIAEHFLYANDDMFFGRPVNPELFFTAAGVTQFVECDVRIGVGSPNATRSGHDNAARVNRELLQRRFGRVITRDLQHCATPHRRSVMFELEREFAEDFARTAASRFRSATDISVTNSLYHYYALMTGRALPTTAPRTAYIQTTLQESLHRMQRLLARRDADMFCLNDGSVPEVPEEVRERAVREMLEAYFPVPAPWERTAADDAA
ncbi:stealth family protein [Microbacterium album]|uniref:Exopolysaccharide phosphotransferase CpsY n=1 Tax=Microbacterium album TaxID=2053191 RepID=A0A917IEA9_9MICO|nr:stealth family protein [Microbacterium album]GGH37732.1 exopolysaccharide phosphotransferase CpsY [Microbacterium album]